MSIEKATGLKPRLAIVLPIIQQGEGRSIEYLCGVLEI
jgi:hypothetical protein